MPLDRLIIVRLEALGERVDGKYVDGKVTAYRVWAERLSSSATDAASAGTGTVVQAIVTWRVRWVTAIARHRVDLISIEADGFFWNVESVAESDERRRFIELRAIAGDLIAA